ncbi:inner membrane-spanning protein YciB [Paracoccus sp. ME4]|uniref:inner membrane-spanning protein YciB n=1 Tax=Paracoccus sp. ME4 TaxID=3138066 RepID=UPI00398B379F
MREMKPWVKPVLDLGPLVLFFVLFMLYRNDTFVIGGESYGGFILATAALIPALIVAAGIQWWLTGRLAPMQIATLVLVVVFGGLSVWLNDPRFLKIKPTIIYLLFAAILGTGLALRRNWLGAVLSEALPMTELGWRRLTVRMTVFLVLLALSNEIVWRTQSESTWVWFETFGLPAALFVFLMANAGLYSAHALPPAETSDDDRAV